MDMRTGEIRRFNQGEVVPEDFLEIREAEMTKKQRETNQVSVNDSQSILGKKFSSARKRRAYLRRNAKAEGGEG